MKQPFADLEVIRQRARKHIDEGAVTGGYGADRIRVLEVLDELLATSLTVASRSRHYRYACHRTPPAELSEVFGWAFEQHERAAQLLADRMLQLRGEPDFRVESLELRSHARFSAARAPQEMVSECLVAARTQIETLRAAIRWLGDGDPTTRRLLEDVLVSIEALADRLDRLLTTSSEEKADEDSRIENERARWSDVPDKPPWWDPQWIARP